MSKVILITGASSGIGQEAAILLGKQGHRVYAGARRMDRMADLADYGVTAVEMDVAIAGDNQRVVNHIIENEGRIEPGSIKTEFGRTIGAQLRRLEGASAYQAQIEPFLRMLDNPDAGFRQTEAKALAKVYAKAATARRPRRRYVVGAQARPTMFTRRWFGDGVYEFMLRYAFRRPMPPKARR